MRLLEGEDVGFVVLLLCHRSSFGCFASVRVGWCVWIVCGFQSVFSLGRVINTFTPLNSFVRLRLQLLVVQVARMARSSRRKGGGE